MESGKTKVGVGHIIFYVLAAAMFLWTASNTLAFVGRALPQHEIAKYLALAIFDVGALAWLIVYMRVAQAGLQRAIALLMTFVDLIGAVLMVFGELTYASGFEIVEVQKIATWSIGIWTALNLASVFVYHIGDQSTRFDLAMREIHDDIKDSAIKDVKAQVNQIKAQVANELGSQMKADVLADFGLKPGKYSALPTQRVIEHDVEEKSIPRRSRRWRDLFRKPGGFAESVATDLESGHTNNGADPTQPPR